MQAQSEGGLVCVCVGGGLIKLTYSGAATGVMLVQIVLQGVPTSTHSHHHMITQDLIKHGHACGRKHTNHTYEKEHNCNIV
jgi:hypothetical protein